MTGELQNMLPGQTIKLADQLEVIRLKFFYHLELAHFMERQDGD
jgi:hypothetical protein